MRPAKQNQRLGTTVLFAVAALLILTACANERGPNPNLPRMGLNAEFTSRNLCSLGVSPEVRLGGVPEGTAAYRWRMTNVSVLFAPSWETELPASGTTIPEGAAADFPTPCMGELERPQPVSYRFEVLALGADRQPLAYGWNFILVRSLPYQLELEQQRAKRRLPEPARVPPRQPPAFFNY